ncbi:hypothetical protein HK099_004045 [Clydaea vesicula]|uniref:Uncharacterized protein n=1 Tax=Clydaea vesicula TaxID=447962 RepID=A0AAD5U2F1_9FUNG|nr:hypothetical protein HK099_004045 [Clydaea vesicula]
MEEIREPIPVSIFGDVLENVEIAAKQCEDIKKEEHGILAYVESRLVMNSPTTVHNSIAKGQFYDRYIEGRNKDKMELEALSFATNSVVTKHDFSKMYGKLEQRSTDHLKNMVQKNAQDEREITDSIIVEDSAGDKFTKNETEKKKKNRMKNLINNFVRPTLNSNKEESAFSETDKKCFDSGIIELKMKNLKIQSLMDNYTDVVYYENLEKENKLHESLNAQIKEIKLELKKNPERDHHARCQEESNLLRSEISTLKREIKEVLDENEELKKEKFLFRSLKSSLIEEKNFVIKKNAVLKIRIKKLYDTLNGFFKCQNCGYCKNSYSNSEVKSADDNFNLEVNSGLSHGSSKRVISEKSVNNEEKLIEENSTSCTSKPNLNSSFDAEKDDTNDANIEEKDLELIEYEKNDAVLRQEKIDKVNFLINWKEYNTEFNKKAKALKIKKNFENVSRSLSEAGIIVNSENSRKKDAITDDINIEENPSIFAKNLEVREIDLTEFDYMHDFEKELRDQCLEDYKPSKPAWNNSQVLNKKSEAFPIQKEIDIEIGNLDTPNYIPKENKRSTVSTILPATACADFANQNDNKLSKFEVYPDNGINFYSIETGCSNISEGINTRDHETEKSNKHRVKNAVNRDIVKESLKSAKIPNPRITIRNKNLTVSTSVRESEENFEKIPFSSHLKLKAYLPPNSKRNEMLNNLKEIKIVENRKKIKNQILKDSFNDLKLDLVKKDSSIVEKTKSKYTINSTSGTRNSFKKYKNVDIAKKLFIFENNIRNYE